MIARAHNAYKGVGGSVELRLIGSSIIISVVGKETRDTTLGNRSWYILGNVTLKLDAIHSSGYRRL